MGREGIAIWGTVGKTLTAVTVLLVLGIAFELWDIDFDIGAGSGPQASGVAAGTFLGKGQGAPREFLYLDSVRAGAYLSQLSGGNETLRTISESLSRKAGGELSLGAGKVSGEAARQSGVERSVSPTTASNFYALTKALTDSGVLISLPSPDISEPDDVAEPASEIPEPSASAASRNFAEQWKKVHEGEIVRFRATVRRPTFVRVYQTLRQAPAASRLGRQGAKVLKAIGDAPRLPLVVEALVPAARHGDKRTEVLRLVMPVQSANLTGEPSLFAPSLTVMGKVVRRVDHSADRYRDLNFFSRFESMRRLLPAVVRGRLNAPRKRLTEELLRYRDITAPAAVILPIAIYK